MPPAVTVALRAHLKERLLARDDIAVEVLRVAIAAIENAGAQPLSPSSQTELLLGAFTSVDVARREVSDDEALQLVAAEVDELLAAARQHDALGETESARRLEQQAGVLRGVLAAGP